MKIIMLKKMNDYWISSYSSARLGSLSKIALAISLANMGVAFANSCDVGNVNDLGTALSNTSCTSIVLTQDITLNRNLTAVFGDRTDITLDGNGYSLNTGNYYITTSGGAGAENNLNFNVINFGSIVSNPQRSTDPVIFVSDQNSKINVTFDNITQMPNNTIAILSRDSTAGVNYQNQYSKLIIGNITNPIVIKLDTSKQLANAANITFTGKTDIETSGGGNTSFSYVFWSNSPINNNKVTFTETADVSIKLADRDRFTTGDGNGKGYAYYFDDGSKFLLWSQQNVFGNATGSNVGVVIGSYDKTTQTFGRGAVINIADVNGATLTGDGLTNRGGASGAIDNGAAGVDDVIFNLAQGSNFNVTGTGIVVTKNAGNDSGIYVRSATDITSAKGIEITHNGTGSVVVANNGVINSTVSGMDFLSTSNNAMLVDFTGGTINAVSGDAITVGSSASTGTANLTIDNGTINISGHANALNLSSSGVNNQHTVTGTTINADSGAMGKIISNTASNITLKETNINIVDSIAFTDTDLNYVTFAQGADDKDNIITVKGSGVALVSSSNLSSTQNSYLTINVTDTTGVAGTTGTGTAIKVTGGDTSDAIVINNNLTINAKNATALDIEGNQARQFTNNGVVTGNIIFNNGAVDNVINNNGTLDGNLTVGSGNNTLNFNTGSEALGTVTLSNGNNNVTIGDNANVNQIIAGSGNDTFNLSNISQTSTNIGTLDAGTGNNTLNLTNSSLVVGSDTFFKNFNSINLNTSNLALLNRDNLSSGRLTTDIDSSLSFTNSYRDNVDFAIDGTGQVNIDNGAAVTLTQDNSDFSGNLLVAENATLNTSASNQLGSSTLNLLGILNISQNQLNNQLTGAGIVNVNTQNNLFNFGNSVGDAFTGIVNLVGTQFNLSGTNTTAVAQAKLQLSDNSVVTVGSGVQGVGNLNLNGGSLVYTNIANMIDTNSLEVNSNSQINVDVGTINDNTNIIDQSAVQQAQLINSSNELTDDELAKLSLYDLNGNSLSDAVQSAINQNGETVAEATYDYSLVKNNGLGLSYQLTALELQADKTLTLNSAGATNKTLTATLTGTGGLTLNSDATGITLDNTGNTYTGKTTVASGKLIIGSNAALGQTTELDIQAGATTDLNGNSQTIGTLSNAGDLLLSEGNLVITNGGSSTGQLIGDGQLTVNGGDLTISTANDALTAQTTIANTGSITLTNTGTLGDSAITLGGDLNLNSNNSLSNDLSGDGRINTNASITLTGNNSGFTGQQIIGNGGALTVNSVNNLGGSNTTVALQDNTSILNLNGVTGELASQLTGTGGTVNINNNANMSLTGDNSQFTGNYTLTNNSLLNVSNSNNLGTSGLTIDTGSSLILNSFNNSQTELTNTLTGSGGLTLSNSDITLSNNNTTTNDLTGSITIKDNSALTVSNANQLNSNATVNIESSNDNLNINSTNAYTLNSALAGNGQLNVNTNNTAFNFGNNANTFNGIVNLQDTQFSLSGNNTTALTDATLQLTGGVTTVGTNEQRIGNLELNGGTIIFNGDGTINTNSLSTANNSILQINTNNIPSSDISQATNLLDQNTGEINQLITAQDSSNVDINKITLQDNNGNSLSDAVQSAINQNGETVAEATYDYSLVKNNGLGLSYQLTALELQADKTLTLNSAGATNKTLTATLTGTGGLTLNSDATGITLDNTGNTYTGKTTVASGKLIIGSNAALGQTTELDIQAGATTDLNGNSQTIGTLSNAGDLLLSEGNLVITNGGSSTGQLIGDGQLTVNGGDLTISTANDALTAQTTIANTGSITLTNTGTLGDSAITLGGDLNLNSNNSLSNDLSGDGRINTNASITLTGNNSGFTGQQIIGNGGALTVNSVNNLGGSNTTVALQDNTSILNLNGVTGELASQLTGTGGTVNINNNANMSLTGDNSQFTGNYTLTNNSLLNVSNSNNLGTSGLTIDTGSSLILNSFNNSQTELTNTLTGSGGLTLSNSDITLSNNNTTTNDLTGSITIKDNSALTVSNANQLNSNATVNIESSNDNLNINSTNAYTLNSALAGNGQLNVNTNNTAFNFGNNANTFNGIVNLQDTQFSLSGNNTTALTDATLQLTGGVTTVGTNEQRIGNLELNGGTIIFNGDGTINTNSLSTANNSILQINTNNIPSSDISQATNLLDQNTGEINQLITAQDSSNVDINKITLQDNNGNSLSDAVQSAINQNGETVAEATYDYSLVKNNGLGLSYQLTALELQADKTLTLNSAGATNKTLTATLTGTGGLTLNSDATGITLDNTGNTYTGKTTVASGKLIIGSNAALGQTTELDIQAGATTDLNGNSQTIGTLSNAGDLLLSEGNLVITNGGSSTGQLIGDGQLTVNGGDLTISTANDALTAQTTIANTGSITLTNTGTLGDSAITLGGDLNLNSNNSLSNDLSGDGRINTNASITLTGNNSGFTGQQIIGNGGALTVSTGTSLGSDRATVNLADASSSLILSDINESIAQSITGNAGYVNIVNNSTINLTGNNSGFNGTYAVDGGSQLIASNSNNIGNSNIDIADNGRLNLVNFNNGTTSELSNNLSGAGDLNLSGSGINLAVGNSNLANLTGQITITDRSNLTVSNDDQLNSNAVLNINTSSDSLAIVSNADYTMNNVLIGQGNLDVSTNNNTFSFGNNVGQAYTGSVNLADTVFALGADNTAALANATLNLGVSSSTTVENGIQTIDKLIIDGGTLRFDNIIENNGQFTSQGTINVNTLDVSKVGMVEVDLPYNVSPSITGNTVAELDSGVAILDLVSANNVIGNAESLTLQDKSGGALPMDVEQGLFNYGSSIKSATGYFNYHLTTGDNDGLSVNYGLVSLNLEGTGSDALILESDESKNNLNSSILNSTISGAGDIAIEGLTNNTIVALDNSNNNYTGKTYVRSGVLKVGDDNSLGLTSELNISAGASTDLNGKSQVIGALINTGELSLGGGNLSITNGGSSTGQLSGSGTLNINGGVLDISGSNANLLANAQVNNAIINISDTQGLGIGSVTFNNGANSQLNINDTAGALQNDFGGSGVINIVNSSVNLVGNNASLLNTSAINVDGSSQLSIVNQQNIGDSLLDISTDGELNINTAQSWELTNTVMGQGTLNKAGVGSIFITGEHVSFDRANINEGSLFISNGKLNSSELYVNSTGYLIGGDKGIVDGNVTNTGNIYISNNPNTRALESDPIVFDITGDLNNTGNVYLSNANSAPTGNRLNVLGDLNGDGNYYIRTQINNQQGDFINVAGAVNGDNSLFVQDTGAISLSPASSLKVVQSGQAGTGSFALQNGTVDLGAYRYDLQRVDNDWYLAALANPVERLSKAADASVGMHSATASMWEEELGSLNTRMGDMRLDNNYNGGVWVRQLSHDIHATPNSSAAYQQNYNGTQVGADKVFVFDGGRFYLGAMTGLSRSTLSFKENTSGSIKSQTFGVYGTTLFDNGYYIDTVLKYGHMKNKIDYHDNAGAKVKASYSTNAFGLSLEGGKRFNFQETWFVEPQLQLTASHLQGKHYSYSNGAEVKSHSMQLFNGRVGVIAGNKYTFEQIVLEPYVELSHTQELSGKGRVSFNDNRLSSDQVGTRQHYGIGINANVAKQHNFFINASYENGQKMEQPWGIKAGYQFRF